MKEVLYQTTGIYTGQCDSASIATGAGNLALLILGPTLVVFGLWKLLGCLQRKKCTPGETYEW